MKGIDLCLTVTLRSCALPATLPKVKHLNKCTVVSRSMCWWFSSGHMKKAAVSMWHSNPDQGFSSGRDILLLVGYIWTYTRILQMFESCLQWPQLLLRARGPCCETPAEGSITISTDRMSGLLLMALAQAILPWLSGVGHPSSFSTLPGEQIYGIPWVHPNVQCEDLPNARLVSAPPSSATVPRRSPAHACGKLRARVGRPRTCT